VIFVDGVIEMGQSLGCVSDLGFEQGLTFWKTGPVYDSVAVISGDAYETPWQGSKMLRIGTPVASSGVNQPIGLSRVYQDCVVCQPAYKIAFSMFTYDYTQFDLFSVSIRDLDTDEFLTGATRGAWGPSSNITLKTSGWRGVTLNTSAFIGRRVRWSYRAGGTSDTLYATWVYIDTAEMSYPSQGINDPYVPPPH
jgi:hypothetical protein